MMLVMCMTTVEAQNDTVTDLVLHVAQTGVRTAEVTWNQSETISAPTLYRRHLPDGNWVNCGEVLSSPFRDELPFTPCFDTLVYRLQVIHSNEVHLSNEMTLEMNDTLPTSPCALDVVTVNEETQQVELRWFPSPDQDVKGYLVCMGIPCLSTDTLYGRENTRLVKDLSAREKHRFRIYAFDSCGTASPLTAYVGNMVLEMDVEDCTGKVMLRWNEYESMPEPVGNYYVMASVNGSEYGQVGEVHRGEAMEYEWQAPSEARYIKVKVVARSEGGHYEAQSNRCQSDLSTSDTAKYLYIGSVKVSADGKRVTVSGCVDPEYEAQPWVLWRAEETSDYSPIFQCTSTRDGVLNYEDRHVDVRNRNYKYRWSVADGCGRNLRYSSQRQTLRLVMTDNNGVHLEWNHIAEGQEYCYQIERMDSVDAEPEVVGTTQVNYWDDTEIDVGTLVHACQYRVTVQVPSESPCGGVDTLCSNVCMFSRPATLWVPNAFTPSQSTNTQFCVSGSMIRYDDYSMAIFDRQGREVFATTDPTECWDGNSKGVPMPQGSYVYTIFVHHLDGQSRVHTGTVLLIR